MKKIIFFISIVFTNFIFAQCENYNQLQCSNNINCEWVEDIESENCSDWSYSNQCNAIDECEWSSYQIDCGTATGYSDCNISAGCSYSWLTYTCSGWTTISECSGGYYEVDNSYCQEIEMPECSEMNQSQCGDDINCGWVEDIVAGYCWNHNTAASCPDYPACSWFCDGCWYLGECCGSYICTGGYYEIDNSTCEESEINYLLGDITQDGTININDVVLVVNLILYQEYNQLADINQDNTVNVADAIQIIDIILNGEI